MSYITDAKEKALMGERLDRDTIINLLSIDPDSEDAEALGKAAREVASAVTGNRGSVWASIGVDYKTCSMNCDFCAFGRKWGIVNVESERDPQEIIDIVRRFVSMGARWVTLRTTQFYGIDKLTRVVRDVRASVPGAYQIVVNTGEFNKMEADTMAEAGVQMVYHTIRLREGINTRFKVEDRISTLSSINSSPLELAYLVEPVGIEHSNAEIADVFLTAMKYNTRLCGVMARVPLQGTPFGDHPQISERRHAQIVAVTRLAAGYHAPDICAHPPSRLAVEWGANVLVVETGAIPREGSDCKGEWHGFGLDSAMDHFRHAGYTFHSGRETG